MNAESEFTLITNDPEGRLLAFLGDLIIDLATTHPNVTQATVSDWLAAVIVGHQRKARR